MEKLPDLYLIINILASHRGHLIKEDVKIYKWKELGEVADVVSNLSQDKMRMQLLRRWERQFRVRRQICRSHDYAMLECLYIRSTCDFFDWKAHVWRLGRKFAVGLNKEELVQTPFAKCQGAIGRTFVFLYDASGMECGSDNVQLKNLEWISRGLTCMLAAQAIFDPSNCIPIHRAGIVETLHVLGKGRL